MSDDDLELPKKSGFPRPDLEIMSLEALDEYIAELDQEIERVKAAIEKKGVARNAADAVFKS